MTAVTARSHAGTILPFPAAPYLPDPEALIPEARRRQRKRWIAWLASLIATGIVAGASYLLSRPATPSPTVAAIERAVAAATPTTRQWLLDESMQGLLPGNQPGTLVPVAVPVADMPGNATVSFQAVDGSTTTWVDLKSGRVKETVISPDGRLLLAGAAAYGSLDASANCRMVATVSVSYSTRTSTRSQGCMPRRMPGEFAQSVADPLARQQEFADSIGYDPGLTSNLNLDAVITEENALIDAREQPTPRFTLVGTQTIARDATWHLRETLAAPPPGRNRVPGDFRVPTRFEVWISRATYRPVQEQWSNSQGPIRTINLRWLPRTQRNLDHLNLSTPAGLKQ